MSGGGVSILESEPVHTKHGTTIDGDSDIGDGGGAELSLSIDRLTD